MDKIVFTQEELDGAVRDGCKDCKDICLCDSSFEIGNTPDVRYTAIGEVSAKCVLTEEECKRRNIVFVGIKPKFAAADSPVYKVIRQNSAEANMGTAGITEKQGAGSSEKQGMDLSGSYGGSFTGSFSGSYSLGSYGGSYSGSYSTSYTGSYGSFGSFGSYGGSYRLFGMYEFEYEYEFERRGSFAGSFASSFATSFASSYAYGNEAIGHSAVYKMGRGRVVREISVNGYGLNMI